MKILNNITIKKESVVLIVFWFIVQFLVFNTIGVNYGFEGDKYIDDANDIISLHKLNYHRLFYSVLPIIIAIIIKLNLSLKFIILLQLFFSFFSLFKFYQIAQKFFNTKWVQLFIPLSLIFSLQIQQWNFFLFTESFFISGVIYLFYRIVFFDFDKLGHYFFIAGLFVILSFLRPVGVLFVVALATFFLININRIRVVKNYWLGLLVIFMSLVFVLIANAIFNNGNFKDYVAQAYDNNWIVWKGDSVSIDADENAVLGFFKLIFWRIVYFFSMYRSGFSAFHNVIMLSIIPYYFLFVFGIRDFFISQRRVFIFVMLLIISVAGFTVLTFVNWHARFMAPLIPFFIMGAGYGLQKINAMVSKE